MAIHTVIAVIAIMKSSIAADVALRLMKGRHYGILCLMGTCIRWLGDLRRWVKNG